jgi:broad specificity phosphatase PhoE
MMADRRLLVACLLCLPVWLAVPGCRTDATDPAAVTVVYLVRHAEKATTPPDDPPLTPAGQARARALARLLADVPLAGVYASDYRRTRLTAAPTLERPGVSLTLYDPGPAGLRELAAGLAGRTGHYLVVGHSNTTPALVELLGGDPAGAIEDSEYDRLYLVTIVPGGPVSTVLLRYWSGL